MEKLFKLRENNTSVRTEVVGGLTTFFAMVYIIFVNPNILSATGMDHMSVFVATCLAAALGCFLTAILANVPFAQAPGMGLNAFFAFTVATGAAGYGMGYTWQQGLTIVLISGIIFLAIMVSPLRGYIIASIPASLKAAIGAGIGLFIAFIGLIGSGTGIIKLDGANHITSLNFTIDGAVNMNAMLTIIGLIITASLMAWNVKGAIFIGIIASTVIAIPMGVTSLPETFTMSDLTINGTFMQLDFAGIMSKGLLPLFTAVISFTVVDMFDTVGTLVGTAGNAGMLDKDGNLPHGDKAIIADAIATCTGACLGTSTVTTYVESSTGISEGARTGLSSVVVGIGFILALVLAPIVGIIPGAATAPALIIVGVLMMRSATKIDWGNIEDAVPCFLIIAMMPFAYSISDGIGFGFIFYTAIKLIRGKAKEVPAFLYIISIVFLAMYVLKNI